MTRPHPLWPQISSCVFYQDAAKAIDWICDVFGFEVRLRIEGEGGRIEHSELTYGDGLVMVGTIGGQDGEYDKSYCASPAMLKGANTQALCVYVDDVDAHFQHAKSAGATILNEPSTNDYGEDYGAHRTYQVKDPEGHHWWFMSVSRDPQNP